jgi:hypothetical protein
MHISRVPRRARQCKPHCVGEDINHRRSWNGSWAQPGDRQQAARFRERPSLSKLSVECWMVQSSWSPVYMNCLFS